MNTTVTKKNSLPTVSVIGLGYVGLTTATLLAEAGYKVYAVEINPERLKIIGQGKSFFYEDGLDPLIAHAIKTKHLIPTDSYSKSIPESDFVFSCVGTPDNPDGSSNLKYVKEAAKKASVLMKPGSVFIQKSTVPVGTGTKLKRLCSLSDKKIHYVSNPEFLREGTAITDSLWFDRVVAGGDKISANRVLDLYKSIEEKRNEIAARADIDVPDKPPGSYFTTNINSAELIKVTANAFLALKISFANSIAKLADKSGADVNEVMDAVGADKRIGRAFLNAGRGYGGGCFPKDVSGLISSAEGYGVDLPIMTSATDVNESMAGYIANKAKERLKSLDGKNLAVLGLSFKAGTSDARRSPGVKLANILAHSGAKVSAYDPQANGEAAEELRRDVIINDSMKGAIENADAIFIATDWPEFLAADLNEFSSKMKGDLFVDCMNAFDISEVEDASLQYIGVGRRSNKEH